MERLKDKISFSNIEVLVVIVLVAIFALGGIIFVRTITVNQNVDNLKKDANFLMNTAKNAYKAFSKSENINNIVVGSDGQTKGMCITIDGLYRNDFLTQSYDNLDGYVVVEDINDSYKVSIWLTDKRYVIEGYDSSKINDLKLNDGITKYEKESFTTKVRVSFTGTSGEKGGTGSITGSNLITYQTKCIDEKID